MRSRICRASPNACNSFHACCADYDHSRAQELTYIIKQDIAALNSQIAQLQAFTQSNLNAGGKQVSEHNKNVVTMLQTKLADTTIGFKDVLEIRTQVRRNVAVRHNAVPASTDVACCA